MEIDNEEQQTNKINLSINKRRKTMKKSKLTKLENPKPFERKAKVKITYQIALAMLLCTLAMPALAQDSDYNKRLPEGIVTPDKVETRIGTLKFHDGIPTKETAELLYDNLDHLRGVETFLNGVPAASLEALRRGLKSIGQKSFNQVVLYERLMDSKSLFLTGNSSTVYAIGFFDLKKDGPIVIEVPGGTGPGTINDAFFRNVIDLGPPGPDAGKGGRYLILPPDYEGDPPPVGIKGGRLFTVKSTSYVNFFILRGFIKDGKPDWSTKLYHDGLKIYPYNTAAEPWLAHGRKGTPHKMEFINASGMEFNTIHSNDFSYFEELHSVIDREPIDMLEPQLRGLFASIGIEKGKPFAPDDRMKKLLTDAVAVGNGTARALLWNERNKADFIYEGSYWKKGYVGDNYEYLKNDGIGGRNLDARTHFYYFATVNSPAMAMHLLGAGSQYTWGYLDKSGDYLDGGLTYKINIPKDAPMRKFWSIAVYDPQSRSLLRTDQPFPTKASWKGQDLIVNDDGSIDLYFGPKAPAGMEPNWTQTISGKGWFCLLRLYSPLMPWYDHTWRPSDIELVK
jgi:hypothetical protein